MSGTSTIIDEDGVAHDVRARPTDDGTDLLVHAGDLPGALGWQLRPEGLCRGDTCIPTGAVDGLVVGDDVAVGRLLSLVDQPAVVDADAGVLAAGVDAGERSRQLASLEAPELAGVPTLDGGEVALADLRGRRKLLVAFASW